MINIFRNLKKYWYFVILILALLLVQAYCDLSLPDYTSDLIDVGISNSGIEHAVPEYLSESGFIGMEVFLTEDEKEAWEAAYRHDEKNGYYTLVSTDKEKWENLDQEFSRTIAIVYMMTSQQDSKFGSIDFSNMDMSAADPDQMSGEQLEQFQKMQQALEVTRLC